MFTSSSEIELLDSEIESLFWSSRDCVIHLCCSLEDMHGPPELNATFPGIMNWSSVGLCGEVVSDESRVNPDCDIRFQGNHWYFKRDMASRPFNTGHCTLGSWFYSVRWYSIVTSLIEIEMIIPMRSRKWKNNKIGCFYWLRVVLVFSRDGNSYPHPQLFEVNIPESPAHNHA
jgi:hypothetical protein